MTNLQHHLRIAGLWKAALYEHFKTWHGGGDCAFHAMIQRNEPRSQQWLNEFSQIYRVRRTLPKKLETCFSVIDVHLARIDPGVDWSTPALADKSIELAEALLHVSPDGKQASPWSLATKIIWFRAPRKALINDRFVRIALDLRSTSDGQQIRQIAQKCSDEFGHDFIKHVDDELDRDKNFEGLFGSRVVDKLLMLVGTHPERMDRPLPNIDLELKCWDKILTHSLTESVQTLAERLSRTFPC